MAVTLVGSEPPKENQYAAGIRAMAERAINEGAIAFMAIWESKGNHTVMVEPPIVALLDGMQRASWCLHQGAETEE